MSYWIILVENREWSLEKFMQMKIVWMFSFERELSIGLIRLRFAQVRRMLEWYYFDMSAFDWIDLPNRFYLLRASAIFQQQVLSFPVFSSPVRCISSLSMFLSYFSITYYSLSSLCYFSSPLSFFTAWMMSFTLTKSQAHDPYKYHLSSLFHQYPMLL